MGNRRHKEARGASGRGEEQMPSRWPGEEVKKAIKGSDTRAAAEGLGWALPGAEGACPYRDSVLATETSSGGKS